MGLFGFGKKDDTAAPAAAAPAATEEKQITVEPTGERDGEKTYQCNMCKNEFKESEGNFVLSGSAFCCNTDCPPKAEGAEDDGTCEFC